MSLSLANSLNWIRPWLSPYQKAKKGSQSIRIEHSILCSDSRCRNSIVCCSDGEDNLANDVHDAQVEDGPELAQEGVGECGAEDGGEVAERDEGVEQNCRNAFLELQELEEEWQDGWNESTWGNRFKDHSHYLRFLLWTAVDSCSSAEIENFLSLCWCRSTAESTDRCGECEWVFT